MQPPRFFRVHFLRSKAEQLADHLRNCIRRGELVEPLPNIRNWSSTLGVSHSTLETALKILKNQGLVRVLPRKGIHLLRRSGTRRRLQPPGTVRWLLHGYVPRHSLHEVGSRASLIFLLADSWTYYVDSSSTMFDRAVTGYSTYGDGTGTTYARHRRRGLNFYFVDGHAQFLRAKGYIVNPVGPTYDQISEWYTWGNDNGIQSPYTPEWYPLNLWNASYCVLLGQ